MTTHTPGPWQVEPWHYRDERGTVLTICTDRDAIAQVCDLWRGGEPDEGEGEQTVNARLIAAAPGMYDALRELVAEFDARDRRAAEEPGCGGINETGGVALARTILARIEGDQ